MPKQSVTTCREQEEWNRDKSWEAKTRNHVNPETERKRETLAPVLVMSSGNESQILPIQSPFCNQMMLKMRPSLLTHHWYKRQAANIGLPPSHTNHRMTVRHTMLKGRWQQCGSPLLLLNLSQKTSLLLLLQPKPLFLYPPPLLLLPPKPFFFFSSAFLFLLLHTFSFFLFTPPSLLLLLPTPLRTDNEPQTRNPV